MFVAGVAPTKVVNPGMCAVAFGEPKMPPPHHPEPVTLNDSPGSPAGAIVAVGAAGVG